MSIHEEVLAAARRLCSSRESWTFTPSEIVNALPHLNERSVRTHVVSRCCANAPSHHAHRWPYFERLQRGVYRIREEHRAREGILEIADATPGYELRPLVPREAVHAVVIESDGQYVAECVEVALVTQADSLDALLANLRDALGLYMAGEDPDLLGLVDTPRLVVTLETSTEPH